MGPLYHLVAKELLVLRRDWHALLLLFAMPTLFIVIMSLALRDTFASHASPALTYYLALEEQHPLSLAVAEKIRANPNFRELKGGMPTETLMQRVGRDEAHFILILPKGFGAGLAKPGLAPLQIAAGPKVEPALLKLFESAAREAVARVYLEKAIRGMKKKMGGFLKSEALGPDLDLNAVDKLVSRVSLPGRAGLALPSSVQQNVPAWLVFAMFFIAIPLSTTWVQERSQGTFSRLVAMGLPKRRLLMGKLLPYMAINLLQVLVMLGVGVYLVPKLGGDALGLGQAPLALGLMALAISFASVSYALLIANLVSSSEQATIFTGVSNLLLAALGGIMVPRFVMPEFMQKLSLLSPLNWGLEGFLDVILRQGGLAQVAPKALALGLFGLCALGLALLRMGRTHGR